MAAAPILISYKRRFRKLWKIKETTRYSFITIAISSVLILAISLLYGRGIIHLFVGDGNDLPFNMGCTEIVLVRCSYLSVWMYSYQDTFTALGNGFISALISPCVPWFRWFFLYWVLPKLLGYQGVWMTMPMAEAVTIFHRSVSVPRLWKELYKKKRFAFYNPHILAERLECKSLNKEFCDAYI